MAKINLLFVENDHNHKQTIERDKFLKTHGFSTSFTSSETEGLRILSNRKVDMVVSELSGPEINGIQFFEKVRKNNIDVPFIFITSDCDVSNAVQAIKLGASDFLLKPIAPTTLLDSIQNAIKLTKEQANLRHSETQLKMLLHNVPDLVYSLDIEGTFISMNG